jgi:predicted dehydrogenase
MKRQSSALKAKVIGAGSIGNHLSHAMRALGHDVTLCDVDLAALERTKNQIYPSRYGCWDEAIKLCRMPEAPVGGFDLVVIGTPPDSHIQLALQALEEEPKAILIEKPVCTPMLEGGDALVSRAKAKGCQLFVGYDHVAGAAAKRVCELIDAGEIGEIQTLDVEFREHWAGIFAAHPWLEGPWDSYVGFWRRGGGAACEHSHGLNLWQHFASRLGQGRIREVVATLDYVSGDGAEYDRLCLVNVVTEAGLVGRVVQDVVTWPPRKWARLQGTHGFIEWHCGYGAGKDAVIFGGRKTAPLVEIFAKTRPDDFILELEHIIAVMQGDSAATDLSVERGLETMLVVAAAHRSSQQGRSVVVDYENGYSIAGLLNDEQA